MADIAFYSVTTLRYVGQAPRQDSGRENGIPRT